MAGNVPLQTWCVVTLHDDPHKSGVIRKDDFKIVKREEGAEVGRLYLCLTVPERLQHLRARLRAWPPLRVDGALALLLLAEALIEVSLADAPWSARLAVLVPAGLMAVAILLRRTAPLVAVTLAVAGIASIGLLRESVEDALEGVWFAWLLVTYSMAARSDSRRLLVGVAISLAGAVVAILLSENPSAADFFFGVVLFIGAPVFAGRALRSRLRLGQALAAKAEQLDRERGRRAEEAAADERARIAGELHDVVAHALGAMTIQAAAARRLADKDAARAAGAFEAIEHTGREALGEIRTLLEVLRGDEEAEQPALAPQPSLSSLTELAEQMRRSGLHVEVSQDGATPAKLPTGVDLTAYRVVQEALEAALEHGGAGAARVLVRYADHELTLEVRDDGPHGGRRMLGLQERVRVFGGRVEADDAGPGGGGHVLRASLPLEGVAA
jgi:signal transduction histidine kinase